MENCPYTYILISFHACPFDLFRDHLRSATFVYRHLDTGGTVPRHNADRNDYHVCRVNVVPIKDEHNYTLPSTAPTNQLRFSPVLSKKI